MSQVSVQEGQYIKRLAESSGDAELIEAYSGDAIFWEGGAERLLLILKMKADRENAKMIADQLVRLEVPDWGIDECESSEDSTVG